MNVCRICTHPNLKEINERIVKGESLRIIANQFELTQSSLFRHSKKCIPQHLTKAFEEIAEKDNFDIMTKIDFLIKETEDIYTVSRSGGKDLLALKSLDSLRNHFQLLINISAQLHANRVLELELLKARNGESDEEGKRELERKLKIPSDEELTVLLRITNKINENNGDVIIEGGYVIPSKNEIDNVYHE